MSAPIATIIKMIESLPVEVQQRLADELPEYIDDLQDEIRWDNTFEKTQSKLVAAAKRAKEEIAQGKATLLDYEQL